MMASSYSSARKQSKLAGLLVTAAVVLGIAVVSLLVGALTGLEPGLGLRLTVLLVMPLLLLVAWAAPKSKADPAPLLNRLLLAVLMAAVFWPPYAIFSLPGIPAMEPKRAALLLLLLLWMYKLLTAPVLGRRLLARMRTGGLPFLLVALLLGWRVVTAFTANQPVFSVIQVGWHVFNYYLIFFFILSSVRDLDDMRPLLAWMVLAAACEAVIGMLERVVGHNLFAGIVPASAEYAQILANALAEKVREGGNRVQATFEHPMMLAEFLVMTVPLAIFIVLRAHAKWLRNAAIASVGLVAIGIVLSGTRSAMLTGFGVVALCMVLYFIKNLHQGEMSLRAFFSVMGLIALVFAVLASMSVLVELVQGRSSTERTSSMARVQQLEMAAPKIQKQPVFGYGTYIGNQEVGFKASKGLLSVDNYFLTITLDTGYPGLALYVLGQLGFMLMGARLFLRGGDRPEAALAGLLAVALAGFLVTRSVLSTENNLIFMSMLCGYLIVLKEKLSAADNNKERP